MSPALPERTEGSLAPISAASPAVRAARRFEAMLFDWDGTAVPDRSADTRRLRTLLNEASRLGLDLAVVSGTHLENVDGQLLARPPGPGELHLLLNRGSEVFRCQAGGVQLIERRVASPAEDEALDHAASLAVQRFAELGLEARIVSARLNRRKLDLIPLPEWVDPPKARIAELLAAVQARLNGAGMEGLADAVALTLRVAAEAGLQRARVSTDAKHIEIGLTDKSDSAHWYCAHLWRRGIAPEQILIVGDEFGPLGGLPGSDSNLLVDEATGATAVSVGVEPTGVPEAVSALGGGPARFERLLRRQVALRRNGALPTPPSDPCWTLRIEGVDPRAERAHESLLTLADGFLGSRGSAVAPRRASRPGVVLAGAYRGQDERSELQGAPLWNLLEPWGSHGRLVRVLDLHTGVLVQQIPGELSALQFSSLPQPGLVVLRALAPRPAIERSQPLSAPASAHVEAGEHATVMRLPLADGVLEASGAQSIAACGERAALTRIAAYATVAGGDVSRPTLRRVRRAQAAGRERLLIEHRQAWAQRWEHADVQISGDPELQFAVRLALYHLMGAASGDGEAAVGARALTGNGYRGHVFWDSDVFVLPFLAATHPPSARSILEYRIRRLPVARETARKAGLAGARFPWESARSGVDVTPSATRNRAGRDVDIHTGQREEHIVADVAWAASCYLDWTGDQAFGAGPGKRLLVETARYWTSRIECDPDGSAHIRGVIGPDEYHERVDDNAYTNVMAHWNLRRAHAITSAEEVDERERARWRTLADALVDGYHADTGIYEQFAGFFDLEPLIIAEQAPQRPIAADLLLSHERIQAAQVIKQADALMLHHLVPEEVAPGSLAANLAFYEPRTAHASSLSPGIHAALYARAGRLIEALAALRLAARIDLDDISDSTAAGVHIAAMGSVWQALAYGFAGVRPCGEALQLDPHIPTDWETLELRVRFRAAQLRIRASASAIELTTDRPVRVSVPGGEPREIGLGGYRCELA